MMTTLLISSSLSSTISSRRPAFCGSSGSIPLPIKPIPRHVVRLRAQAQDVAADVCVRLGDRVFDLLERDTVMPELPRVDEHLILLDGPAKAGDIDHSWHRLQLALEHPILDRLELVEGVTRSFEHIPHDLTGGAPGR